jgi:hydroxyethylthiazole kinase-like uncharacterized protein yjeF
VLRRIGIDTCGFDRMATAVARSGQPFLEKVFTPAELAYCEGRVERLAGRWAAKEAIIKCFDGTPLCFHRREIEVLPAESGAPRVRLGDGNSDGDGGAAQVQLTITHQGGLAVAAASLEMPEPDEALLPAPEPVTLPDRPAGGHKGTFGTAVVVAGSRGFTGAAYLASAAAARTGAGLVRLLVAEGIYPILAVKCTEVMATPVPESAPGAVGEDAHGEIREHLDAATAGVVGPGLGRDPSTWRLVCELAQDVRIPLVLDADALNALAENRDALGALAGGRVLTPHPGEMSRLLRRPTADINRGRTEAARAAAAEWGAVIVLKGAGTVVAAPDGRVSVDPHQVPALATGGTGDVLSGVLGALLAQGVPPYEAAVTAVYVHAAAGRQVAARLGDSGLVASDLLLEVPEVMRRLRAGEGGR